MEGAIFSCAPQWEPLLPPGIRPLRRAEEAEETRWGTLALTAEGLSQVRRGRCEILLLPGDCTDPKAFQVRSVVSYGLSRRDTLTVSSLTEPVICLQRTLLRPDGIAIEPQEFPLKRLPCPMAEFLPIFGLRLLHMPLAELERF